jgi:hypothetical protein
VDFLLNKLIQLTNPPPPPPFPYYRYIESSKSAREALRHRWKSRILADAKAFIRLQTNLKSVHLKKGDIVYKEGDMGKSMYFVDEERGGECSIKFNLRPVCLEDQ